AYGWVNAINARDGDNDGRYGGAPDCNGQHGDPPGEPAPSPPSTAPQPASGTPAQPPLPPHSPPPDGVLKHAHVTLRVSRSRLRNGEVLTMRGRIPTPIPSTGAIVLLQGWKGGKWVLFGELSRARRNGRFSRGYRFEYTSGVQHYRLRALVPRQYGYPYATS